MRKPFAPEARPCPTHAYQKPWAKHRVPYTNLPTCPSGTQQNPAPARDPCPPMPTRSPSPSNTCHSEPHTLPHTSSFSFRSPYSPHPATPEASHATQPCRPEAFSYRDRTNPTALSKPRRNRSIPGKTCLAPAGLSSKQVKKQPGQRKSPYIYYIINIYNI